LTNPLFNPDLAPRNIVYAFGLEYVIVYGVPREDVLIAGSFSRVGGGGTTRRSYDDREIWPARRPIHYRAGQSDAHASDLFGERRTAVSSG